MTPGGQAQVHDPRNGLRRPDSGQALPALVVALAVIVLAFLWLGIWTEQDRARRSSEAASRRELDNLARTLAEHTARTIEGADQVVRLVRREYLAQGDRLDLAQFVDAGAVLDVAYRQVAIIGADGLLVQTSFPRPNRRIDLSDRAHYQVHRNRDADTLFISRPVVGRVSNQRSLQITRRITAADGQFAGVVVLSLSTDYLAQLYQGVQLGSSGAGRIALLGADGIVRVECGQRLAGDNSGRDRSEDPVFRAASAALEGALWSVSTDDGLRRLWAFRVLQPYGLIVAVGRPEADVFAGADVGRNSVLMAGVLVSVVVLVLMLAALQKARKQARSLVVLRDSAQRASDASQSKSRFVASVSHELRTPLNGILGYAELVREEAREPEIREYAEIIFASATHLHNLVNTILDLSKLEAGELRLHLSSVELRDALNEVQNLHQVSAQQKGLELRLTVDPACPHMLRTDRMRLLQIVGNLVHNAVKFTDHGSVTITATRTASGVDIAVTDTGPGIAAERIDGLLQRTRAASDDFVHPMQGAGLGLPLARELAELIGGRLQIDRDHRPGARLVLSLPLTERGESPA